MRKLFSLIIPAILILSVFSISIVAASAANECNLWCKIVYLFTGKIPATGGIVKTITGMPTYNPSECPAGMVSYYEAENNAQDSVGTNNGQNNGATYAAGKTGLGQAFIFDGGSYENIDLGNPASLQFGENDPFSVFAWVYLNDLSGRVIVDRYTGNGGYFTWLLATQPDGTVGVYAPNQNAVAWYFAGPSSITAGTWYHVGFTYNGSTGIVYINGVAGTSSTRPYSGSAKDTSTTTLIGGYSLSNMQSNNMNGKIDEVAIFNKSLSASEVQQLAAGSKYCAAAPPAPTCPNGMVSYWKFEETGGTTAVDSLGRINGAINGGVTVNQAGKVGKAYSFDGSSGYVFSDDDRLWDFPTFTVAAWANTANAGYAGQQAVLGHSGTADSPGVNYELFYKGFAGGSSYSMTGCCGWYGALSTVPVQSGDWHFVVGSYDGTNYNIYVDGVLNASYAHAYPRVQGIRKFAIGAYLNPGITAPFNGKIDEVAVFNKSLSPTEIQTLYDNTKTGTGDYCTAAAPPAPTCPNGMVSYWKFDETSGTTASDSAGSNPGTLTNGPTWAGSGGISGGALSLDGNDDYVNLPTSIGFPYGSSPRTVCAWVKHSRTNVPLNAEVLLIYGNGPTLQQYYLWFVPYAVNPSFSIDYYSRNFDVPDTRTVGQWQLYCHTYDGSTDNLYIDGSSRGSRSIGAVNTVKNDALNRIGGWSTSGHMLGGLIDEFAIFNRSLSSTEILDLYNNGLQGKGYCAAGPPTECGNGQCETGETVQNCPQDCNICGDGVKYGAEQCDSDSRACTIGGYAGTQHCLADCSGYGTCVSGEYCGDGVVNNGEVCDTNSHQPCYTGNPSTRHIGICTDGVNNCKSDCTGYDTSACNGQILPGIEGTQDTCWNLLDDDCDNAVDKLDDGCTIGGGGQALPPCTLIDADGDGQITVADAVILNNMAADINWSQIGLSGCEMIYARINR